MSHLCFGCGLEISDGEEMEIESVCRRAICDHAKPEECARSTLYSHSNDECFDTASERAMSPLKT